MKRALVRLPGKRLADGLVTHVERQRVDRDAAVEQWDAYVTALAAAGWVPVTVPPADHCPDAVFVEDVLVIHDGLAVLTRPGAPSRLPELPGAETAVRNLGLEVARIEPPGTLDGGDVLQAGETVYVGTGGRTNAAGAAQLRALLEPRGATVVELPVHGVLHLKTAVTALPDGTVIGCPPLVPAYSFPVFRAVPEPSGVNVLLLGGRSVLLAADCPRTADLLASLGLEPVVVDIGELQKLEAGVTCLSVLLQERM